MLSRVLAENARQRRDRQFRRWRRGRNILRGHALDHLRQSRSPTTKLRIMLAAAQKAGSGRNTRSPAPGDRRVVSRPSGGNICCVADSSLVDSNTISGGRATLGGAIYCEESCVRVRRNGISANGGAYTARTVCFLSGNLSIEANTITGNTSWHDSGAGLYCSRRRTYRIVGNTISGNTCDPE